LTVCPRPRRAVAFALFSTQTPLTQERPLVNFRYLTFSSWS
jgi:hypothetical protein